MLEQVERVPGLVATVHARVPVSESVRAWHDRFHQTLEAMVADELGRRGVPKPDRAMAARIAIFVLEGLLSHHAGDPAQREATVRFVTKIFDRVYTVSAEAHRVRAETSASEASRKPPPPGSATKKKDRPS